MIQQSNTPSPSTNKQYFLVGALSALTLLLPMSLQAYPTDDVSLERTKIRRLKRQMDINAKLRRGRRMPPGGQWSTEQIKLRLTGVGHTFDLSPESPKDPELQSGLEAILKKHRFKKYNVAVLDISDPSAPRYAGVNELAQQTPGSVAKVLVGGALMNALKERFPNDIEAREELLRTTLVAADEWAMPNHHEVPVITGNIYEKYWSSVRKVEWGDTFSLWEWIDHALSPSSNSAATMSWREAVLIRLLGEDYPPEKYDQELFSRWSREEFTEAVFDAASKPLVEAGLGTEDFYLRMFFTRRPAKYIHSKSSRANPYGLIRWMLRLEQGRMVDEFSSLELKRLLYLTRRRTRYAFTPTLNTSAVYFKTGSLYSCTPATKRRCKKYMGDAINVLNGMIIVETPPPPEQKPPPAALSTEQATSESSTPAEEAPPPEPKHVYMVAVMSNELKRNAASDHASLAADIHKLITREKPSSPK